MASTAHSRGSRYSACSSSPLLGVKPIRKCGNRSHHGPGTPSWRVQLTGSSSMIGWRAPSPGSRRKALGQRLAALQPHLLDPVPAREDADAVARRRRRRGRAPSSGPSKTRWVDLVEGSVSSVSRVTTPSRPRCTTMPSKSGSPRSASTMSPVEVTSAARAPPWPGCRCRSRACRWRSRRPRRCAGAKRGCAAPHAPPGARASAPYFRPALKLTQSSSMTTSAGSPSSVSCSSASAR